MARVIVWFSAFLACLMIGFFFGKYSPSAPLEDEKTSKSDSTEVKALDIRYVDVRQVKLDTISINIKSKGRVSDGKAINITSEVQGKIMAGGVVLKKGTNFKKGQLIAKINNSEAELLLKSRKSSFLNVIANVLPDIQLDFEPNYNLWKKFFELISVGSALPDLPPFKGGESDFLKFRNFLTAKGIMSEYYTIRSEEERFRKYYIHAPFDGSIIDAFAEEGTIANPGSTIVRVAKKGIKEIEVPVSAASASKVLINSEVTITNEKGQTFKGKVSRKGDYINPLTQSIPVFVEILNGKSGLFSGEYVDVEIKSGELNNAFSVTRRSLQDENQIYFIKDSSIVMRTAKIEHLSDNEVILSGIDDNTFIVIEPIANIKDGQKIGALIQN